MRPLLFLLLLLQALPVAAQLAPASWQPPAFLYGYRSGRFEINATNPQPDNSLPEKVLFLEPDGAGGAFIVQNVKRGGYFPGLPASPFRTPGTYLGRIDRLGRYQWVRLINRGGEYSYSYQLTILGAAADGYGNILLWGQNKDTLSFDGHFMRGLRTIQLGTRRFTTEYPFVMSFSQTGNCNWIHQIGSGNFGSYENDMLGSKPDQNGIWIACSYKNLDSTALATPFPLSDSSGIAMFHMLLPSGVVDRYRTLYQTIPYLHPGPFNYLLIYGIVSDQQGTAYWTGGLYNRDLDLDGTIIHPDTNTYTQLVGSLDLASRLHLTTLLPTPFAEVHDFDYRPESSTLRFRLQTSQDSLALPGMPVFYRRRGSDLSVLAQMDTTGRWQWANAVGATNFILGERTTPSGRETIWGSAFGNRGPVVCQAFGPDTLCSDPTQPANQLVIWATDSTARTIHWGLLGGGSVSYDEFEGIRACMIEGPAMLVGTGADTSFRFTQAFFAGPFVDRSNQHNSLLVGVLLPQGSHPVATAPRLEAAQTVWPNPVGSGARLRWSAARPGDRVEVYDLAGRRMHETVYSADGLQLPTLKPGMYLLRSSKAAVRVVVEE